MLTDKLCNQHAQMIDVIGIIVYQTHIPCGGPVAEWLCSGLQNRVHRFNSGPGLHRLCVFLYVNYCNDRQAVTMGRDQCV